MRGQPQAILTYQQKSKEFGWPRFCYLSHGKLSYYAFSRKTIFSSLEFPLYFFPRRENEIKWGVGKWGKVWEIMGGNVWGDEVRELVGEFIRAGEGKWSSCNFEGDLRGGNYRKWKLMRGMEEIFKNEREKERGSDGCRSGVGEEGRWVLAGEGKTWGSR